eukprot:XP_011669768.1 PREDICTED: uncharacterized protein LOC105440883 [Strongylocentrotus purpuratus]
MEKRKAEDADVESAEEGSLHSAPPRKMLRSSLSPTKGRHVLPAECIVCRKIQWKTSKLTGKRFKVPVSRCEQVSATKFLKAAEMRQHTRILMQIRGKDMVAIELQYHKSCYQDFTSCLRRAERAATSTDTDDLFTPTYNCLCDLIRRRIVKDKEVLRLKDLHRSFVKAGLRNEGVDLSSYQTKKLKQRLQVTFPQLIFVSPQRQNESEIVMVGDMEASSLAEHAVQQDQATSTSFSEESASDEESAAMSRSSTNPGPQQLLMLYHASQILKAAVKTACTRCKEQEQWPPTSPDLTPEAAKEAIPSILFNFLSWVVNSTNEPEVNKLVDVSVEDERKLLSMCQDVMYMSCKGSIILPKHSSLAMTVRHMTGSARLIGILNGFGHCSSHSMVLEHDTALAEQQLNRGEDVLPEGVKPCLTTLVWDNNDFSEETLSGKGTTHITTGILIQHQKHVPVPDQDQDNQTHKQSLPRTHKRSIKTPTADLTPYFGMLKNGPEPFGQHIAVKEEVYHDIQEKPRKLDSAFRLSRIPHRFGSLLPSWTGYNTQLSCSTNLASNIFYLPSIDASPTQKDTINTILHKSVKIGTILQQDTVVIVCDQAIYSKAQQIRWKDPHLSARTVVRMGDFHTTMNFLACIGKRFKDGGLQDIIIESGLIATGSVNGVLSGHHFNRSLRAHKLLCEAMERLRWLSFMKTLPDEQQEEASDVLLKMHTTFPSSDHRKVIEGEQFEALLDEYSLFIETQSSRPTFAFWSSYIEMVESLLLFNRATKEGNWPLHLSAARSLLPWFFAYDHLNYSRYMSAYWLEMHMLPVTHPSIAEAFLEGDFVVHRQTAHGFSGIAGDQMIEQTVNRDTKSRGGVIGYSTSRSYFHRWLLSHHLKAAIQRQCEELAGKSPSSTELKDLQASRVKKDNSDIQAICDTIHSMVNPFENQGNDLLHISSGVIASDALKNDLLQAKSLGQAAAEVFITERLQQGSTEFHAPLKQQQLKTFSKATSKPSKGKVSQGLLKQDRRWRVAIYGLESYQKELGFDSTTLELRVK